MLHTSGFRAELTPRELEILELVASGYSAKEIAGALRIAPRTVERHIENLRLKMRARNRAHMVSQAVKHGLLRIASAPVEPRLCTECLLQREYPEEPAPLRRSA